jgi:hypothetical protein
MAASEPISVGRRGPELSNTWQRWSSPLREAEPRAMGHMAAPEPTQQGGEAWGHETRGSTGVHLSKEVRSGVAGYVVAPEPTSAGRCGPKLQLTWQRVNARPAPCLDLELVCGGSRSSVCRQRPPGPPRERLRTRRWGQFFDDQLSYLIFYSTIDGGPREVPELKVQKLETLMADPLWGAGVRFDSGHYRS